MNQDFHLIIMFRVLSILSVFAATNSEAIMIPRQCDHLL